MLTHEIVKRENALVCDTRIVSVVMKKMAKEGYIPFCMIAMREGVDETTFLTQIDFLRYPIPAWEGEKSHAYKTVLVKTDEGLRATFFINRDAFLTQAYSEGSFLESYTFGVGEFFWLLAVKIGPTELAHRLCHKDKLEWYYSKPRFSYQASLCADNERYDDFYGRVCRYGLAHVESFKFGVLGILQVAEYIDDPRSPVDKKTLEQVCMMLENHYIATGQHDRQVYSVINANPWEVPVNHPKLRHLRQRVKNGYLVIQTSDLSQLSTGAERIVNDFAELGKTINTDFLLKNPKVNVALACEQTLRVTLHYSLFREQSYCTNVFHAPGEQHPDCRGELDIGLNLASDDILAQLPTDWNRDVLFGLMQHTTKIDLSTIQHKFAIDSEWIQIK